MHRRAFRPMSDSRGWSDILSLVPPRHQVTSTANGSYIRSGEKIIESSAALAAVVPEAGVSFWLMPKARLNLGAGYYVTTSGRSQGLSTDGTVIGSDPRDGA